MYTKVLSIIIPVYNAAEYLGHLFKSIEQQISDRIEVIFVNDGSTDRSLELINLFCRNKTNTIVVNQRNQGGSAARNNGLNYASGEYIYFFDADDSLCSGILKILLDDLIKIKPDIYIGNGRRFDEKGHNIGWLMINPHNETTCEIEKLFYLCPNPGNKVFRFDIIKKFNITFDALHMAQDLDFYLKYIIHCSTIHYSDLCMYNYLLREDGISHIYSIYILDVIKCFKYITYHYRKYHTYHKYKDILDYNLAKYLVFQFYKVPRIKGIFNRMYVVRHFSKALRGLADFNDNDIMHQIKKFKFAKILYVLGI